jgi:predicted nuclease of predicted toxin-antitoxin system
MKLLFDSNLSHRLLELLKDLFPESVHVTTKGLDESSDREIWEYAKENGYTIVTKDSDFNDFSVVYGTPPKVIWIRTGNCKISDIESLIRKNFEYLKKFLDDSDTGIIRIG